MLNTKYLINLKNSIYKVKNKHKTKFLPKRIEKIPDILKNSTSLLFG